MTKDVLITVKGMQAIEAGEGQEEVEVVAKGDYYFKNGHHFICYEEMLEGFETPTKNMIKITDNTVEVQKKGITNWNTACVCILSVTSVLILLHSLRQ